MTLPDDVQKRVWTYLSTHTSPSSSLSSAISLLVQWMSSESLKWNSGSQPGQIIDPVSVEFLKSSVPMRQKRALRV